MPYCTPTTKEVQVGAPLAPVRELRPVVYDFRRYCVSDVNGACINDPNDNTILAQGRDSNVRALVSPEDCCCLWRRDELERLWLCSEQRGLHVIPMGFLLPLL